MPEQRHQRTYDHRLRELVRTTGDLRIAAEIGVPRSTAMGWLRAEHQEVVTIDVLDMGAVGLQAEVLRLRRRVRILGTVIGVWLILLSLTTSTLWTIHRRGKEVTGGNAPRAAR